MAGEIGGSVLDALKAGAIISEEGGETEHERLDVAGSDADTGNAALTPTGPVAGTDDPFSREFERPEPAKRAEPKREPAGSADADTGERDGRSSPEAGAKRAATRRANAIVAETVTGVETILLGIHASLAVMLKDDQWAIESEEAAKLADALVKVQAQYGMRLDPKTQAWLHLLGVAGSIYGPRIGAMMLAREMAKARAREQKIRADDIVERTEELLPRNDRPAEMNGSVRPGFASAPTNPSQMLPPHLRGAHN